jgi:hypothetical protein
MINLVMTPIEPDRRPVSSLNSRELAVAGAVRQCPGTAADEIARLLGRSSSVDRMAHDLLITVIGGRVYPGPRRVVINLKDHKDILTASSDSGIIELLDNQ